MPEMPQDRIAFDRAASVRTIDQDGHMHIATSVISAAAVNGYYGKEIPESEALGLTPDKIYMLLRDPDALEKAVSSFQGKPLLIQHKPQTAEGHDHDLVVGSVNNPIWDSPNIKAELVIWDADAIRSVEDGSQKDLSAGYYYTPVMTPGVYLGKAYDGIMTGIIANHVALVPEGRVNGAFVGDSAIPLNTETPTPEDIPAPPPESIPEVPSPYKSKEFLMAKTAVFSRTALQASGALQAYLMPKMASDVKFDLTPIIKDVTGKNWKSQKPKIKAALDRALQGKLARDASIDDVVDMLDRLVAQDEEKDDEDEDDKKKKAAEDEDDDDEDDKKKKAAEDEEEEDKPAEDEEEDDEDDDKKKPAFLKGKDKKGARDKAAKDKAAKDAETLKAGEEPKVSKSAMDAAIASAVKNATRVAETNTIARLRSIAEAEKAVRPYIGELAMAQDTAEDVYRLALDHAEVDLDGVPPAAFAAMVKMLPKPGDVAPVAQRRIATDSATLKKFEDQFPGVRALKQR